ncbi:iron(III) transport system substrate-binding protein [Keratinibaculum paraultunense]|uniref:Iron(III) transport system substrate-binding protein n=1 Tax=Keratinibaculum paraultunense TaxID=1278232 RepID=A0A4R3KZE1_9FIRM|nr:ABC transporter substrate-binding protein [Keratinibaculum paraultunense]QQY79975.1 ABC transporter substrate-binding protein [Keratinibaculum paraultunense]TCS91704.1 iron(III) transport system substrate-binding protein [Keratinibaculum paraultunense]
MEKRIFALFMIFILSFGLVACEKNDISQKNNTTSTEVSKKTNDKPFEGTTLSVLVAYGGADTTFEKFTEETGIKVDFLSMSTGSALAKLQAEDGKTEADIWFGGGVDSYLNARDLGYLEPYKSPELSAINPQYCDKDGYFSGLALVPAGWIVNNDILEEKGLEPPKTWEDLADPKYKGEVIMADPAISGTNYAIVSGLIQAWGEEKAWDYFERLSKNIDFFAQGGGEPLEKVAAGEFAIGIVAITGGTYAVGETSPTSVIYPEDLIPWTPAPIAIFKNTKNLEAAKVFVDWYLSKHGQEILREADARIMARDDVEVPELMKELDKSKLIDFDLELMGSEREAILKKWKEIVGDK